MSSSITFIKCLSKSVVQLYLSCSLDGILSIQLQHPYFGKLSYPNVDEKPGYLVLSWESDRLKIMSQES